MHIVLLIDIAIIVLAFLSLFASFFPWLTSPVAVILAGMAALLLVVHFTFFPFRWQLVPAALVIGLLLMGGVFGWQFGPVLSFIGYGAGTLGLLLSLALVVGLPVRNLPEPDGPDAVGVTKLVRAYTPMSKTRHLIFPNDVCF